MSFVEDVVFVLLSDGVALDGVETRPGTNGLLVILVERVFVFRTVNVDRVRREDRVEVLRRLVVRVVERAVVGGGVVAAHKQ